MQILTAPDRDAFTFVLAVSSTGNYERSWLEGTAIS